MTADYVIPYGYVPDTGKFNSYLDNRHLLTFGPTRSGKGASVIVPALLQVPHSVLCVDPKGQNAAITARRRRELGQDVFLLNPFDELGLGTARLNPLAGLRIDDRNVVADARSLGDALIIPSPKDPHWTSSALDLVTTLILYLVATEPPGTATLPKMRKLLTQPHPLFLETIKKAVALLKYPFISQPAGRFHGETNEIRSVISTAITQTFFLDDPNIVHVLSGNDFTLRGLKAKPTTVFLILPGRYIDAYARFFRLMVTNALDGLTAEPGGIPTLFLLDEFATLENLSAVSRAFGFAAGYNVQVWPFLQDLPQLKSIYNDKWETFLANAGLVQFFTPSDMTTAQYVSQRGGQKTGYRESYSTNQLPDNKTGSSSSVMEERIPLMPVEELMSLDRNSQIVYFAGLHDLVSKKRWPYWSIPRLAGMYDRDPFHV